MVRYVLGSRVGEAHVALSRQGANLGELSWIDGIRVPAGFA